MAITVQELLDHPERISELYLNSETCTNCGVMLQETITGKRPAPDGKHTCSDCYYAAFGKEIEQQPLGRLD